MAPDETRDLISPALRAAEQQIDSAYLSNPLMRLPFAEAAWYFLAFCEERIILPIIRAMETGIPPSISDQTAIADNVINHAKWPLHWQSCACAKGGRIPTNYDADRYTAAFELSELSRDYLPFEAAFTHASHGVLRLKLDGRRICTSGEMRDDTRFDAYDRILDMQAKNTVLLDPPDRLASLVAPSVRVDGERFDYKLTPRLVQQVMDWARPTLEDRFALPIDWELTGVLAWSVCESSQCAVDDLCGPFRSASSCSDARLPRSGVRAVTCCHEGRRAGEALGEVHGLFSW